MGMTDTNTIVFRLTLSKRRALRAVALGLVRVVHDQRGRPVDFHDGVGISPRVFQELLQYRMIRSQGEKFVLTESGAAALGDA
jgi:hypothetical protein